MWLLVYNIRGKNVFLLISRSCVISEEAIKMFPVNFDQSWKRTNELNEALFWFNYGKSRKTLKKYTDKICDQILKAKNTLSAEMFLENQNTVILPGAITKIKKKCPLSWPITIQ